MLLYIGSSVTLKILADTYKSFLSMSFHLLSSFSRVHTDGTGLREKEVEGDILLDWNK
jgi:hypothetical protein